MAPRPDAHNQGTEPGDTWNRLLEMITGFRVSQMIYVAARLSLPDLLQDGPKPVETLAEATGTHTPSLYRLLRALASVGVFAEDAQGSFGLTPLASLLQASAPHSLRPIAVYWDSPEQWKAWGELLYSITTGQPSYSHLFGVDPWEDRAEHPELNDLFNQYMAASTESRTAAVAAAYDFSGSSTLVDVGGGQGTLIAAILQANPGLKGILCDAPHVVVGAPPVLERAGVADRCKVVPCDFFSAVPGGGDVYLLKSVVHDWDDQQARIILKNCRSAMTKGARLLLVEYVIPAGNSSSQAKITDLHMLVILGGKERTEAEFRQLLSDSGFSLSRVLPTRAQVSILECIAG